MHFFMSPIRIAGSVLAALILVSGTSYGPATTRALADGGFLSVNQGLNLAAGVDTGHVTLATTFFIPSVDTAGAPNPTIDWGDGVTDTLTPDVNIVTSNTCYVQGVSVPVWSALGGLAEAFAALVRCDLRGHHTYQTQGQYDLKVSYSTGAAISYSTDVPVTVAPGTTLFQTPQEITPLAGTGFSGVVATFEDSLTSDQASRFSATISWGDGPTSDGTVTGADAFFGVNGSHTYKSAGTYTVDAKVSCPGNTVDIYSTAVVAAPPTMSLATPALAATLGKPVTGIVGNFAVSGDVVRPTDYRATIDWGDGTPADTSGTFGVSPAPAGVSLAYGVSGTHTYNAAGQFTTTLTVDTLGGGDPLSVKNEVNVSPCTNPSPSTSAYARAVLASTPAAYWRLDAGCADDSSGHGINGTLDGGVSANPEGAPALDVKGSTSFDGSTGFISLGDPTALQPTTVSVEAWVKPSRGGAVIVRKRLYGYVLSLDPSGRPLFGIDDVNAVQYSAYGPSNIADGAWHYLVGTYDGNQVCLYVDSSQPSSCAAALPIFYAKDLVAIGRDGGASDACFAGSIDDVAIYAKALTPSDVRSHLDASKQSTTTQLAQSGLTLTATATGAVGITPTGGVTLKEGTNTLKTEQLGANVTATFGLGGLTAGKHSLIAVYGGDSNSQGSSSTALTVTVSTIGTSTTVSTSNNNAPHFAPLTFTAVVTSAGTEAPSGTVTFLDGGTPIGTATLNNGVATLSLKPGMLPAGVHSITAMYQGDGKFGGSTSQPAKQIIQANG